jgi:hypothetical protein
MPAFCARWPDGSFSIVDADDETHAPIQLDELGDEPAELWQLQSCLLDFELTERGTFRIRQFGEQTGPEIMERAYPVLSKAMEAEAFAEHGMEDQGEALRYGSEATEVLRQAVEAERERLSDFQRASATTEQGKGLQRQQRQLGASGAYIDAMVMQAASAATQTIQAGREFQTTLNHDDGQCRATESRPICDHRPRPRLSRMGKLRDI